MARTFGSKNGEFGAKVDRKQFEALCGMMCTKDEICAFFGVSDDTMRRWSEQTYGMKLGEAMKAKSDLGKISLRRCQFEIAKKNPTMAIWLGKQYLGQTDRIEAEVTEGITIINDIDKAV